MKPGYGHTLSVLEQPIHLSANGNAGLNAIKSDAKLLWPGLIVVRLAPNLSLAASNPARRGDRWGHVGGARAW